MLTTIDMTAEEEEKTTAKTIVDNSVLRALAARLRGLFRATAQCWLRRALKSPRTSITSCGVRLRLRLSTYWSARTSESELRMRNEPLMLCFSQNIGGFFVYSLRLIEILHYLCI